MDTQFGLRWHMRIIIDNRFKQSFWFSSTWFLIGRLEICGFNYESPKLINSYLTDRKHGAKINSSYISFLHLLMGVPQKIIEHQVSVIQITLNSNLSNINKRLLIFFCKPLMFRCRIEKLILSILFKFRDDSSSWIFKIKCVKEIFIWI